VEERNAEDTTSEADEEARERNKQMPASGFETVLNGT
jgi:hypothetical protein